MLVPLPPSLRQHVFGQLLRPARITTKFPNHGRSQAFGSGIRRLAKESKPQTAKVTLPKTTRKPGVLPPIRANTAPPSGQGGPIYSSNASVAYISHLTARGPVTLYTSPRHGTFFTLSYVFGSGLILGSALWADVARRETNKPWWISTLTAVEIIAVTAMGTACLLAPRNMIKSISLLPSRIAGSKDSLLRLEVKRALPLLKPDVIETNLSNVSMNRSVRATHENIAFTSVPMREAEAFTKACLYPETQTRQARSVLQSLGAFNRSLVNAWPAIKRDVRRMWMRDQMAFVRVTSTGRFKLDLQECHLLDAGQPLTRVMKVESEAPGFSSWFSLLTRG